MVSNKVLGAFLILLIIFLSLVLLFVTDLIKVIDLAEKFPFLKPEPELVSKEHEPKDILEAEELKKAKEKLLEEQEKLVQRELELKEWEEALFKREDDINEKEKSLEIEKEKLAAGKKDLEDYQTKVKDMAGKIANMPPEDSINIVSGWQDYEIISVFKQMDQDAQEADEESIVPYLITLLDKKEPGRGGIVMGKWMQDPKLSTDDINEGEN
jgi:flagellar protein FlbB